MKKLIAVAAMGLLFVACDDSSSSSGGEDAGTTWETGAYTITIDKVFEDGCVSGAANVIAIPGVDADATAVREFENPVTFPASSATFPAASSLQLISPFKQAELTFVKQDDGKLVWDPKPTNTDVALGELNDTWGQCVADFEVGGEWTPVKDAAGNVRFTGKVDFIVTKTNEDPTCPVFDAMPCTIALGGFAEKK